MKRRDDALDRIVEQDRADAAGAELEPWVAAEERLVLPDRLALVVEVRPAAADPARISQRRTVGVPQPVRARPGACAGSRARSRRNRKS